MKKNMSIVLGVLLLLGGIFWSTRPAEPIDTRIPVTASLYPVAFLAERIGGDMVSVKTVVPPGVEPHDFDPSLRDVSDMYRSRLVIMNGAGVDRWAERLEGDLTGKGVRVIVLARSIDLLDAIEGEGGEGGKSGVQDPHFWLDPIAYRKSAEAILQGLIDIDPAHATIYRTNFGRFEREIATLDTRFQSLSGDRCRLDTVIVSHNAFSYLAKRYGFGVRSIVGIDPEREVSAGELAAVIRFMKEKNIRFILSEPFGNADIATTIRKEISAETLILNPIEGLFPDDLARGENYFTVMNANWITLRKALECQ